LRHAGPGREGRVRVEQGAWTWWGSWTLRRGGATMLGIMQGEKLWGNVFVGWIGL
jgi:hypothetical protein